MVPKLSSQTDYRQSVRRAIGRVTGRGRAVANVSIRGVAFWLAIALPWLLLGFSVFGGIARHPTLFGSLLVATFLCAVLGHDHTREA